MNYEAIIPNDVTYFLNGFRKDYYPQRFDAYCRIAQPELEKLPRDLDAAADALIRCMDSRATGLFRKRKRLDQELLLMQFTVPAAIRAGRRDFGEVLQAHWNAAHPEFAFGIASYEEFYKNFNNTLLGFKIDRGEEV